MTNMISKRQQIEREYHNKKAKEGIKPHFETQPEASYDFFWDLVGPVQGLRVLDVGCGDGWVTVSLAKKGAQVSGIDISDELINTAQRRAEREHLQEPASFHVMASEDLRFPENSFDLAIGSAILHHTDIELSVRSIYRVLKQGGRGVFIEPMNQNVVLKFWRAMTPNRRTPTERALTSKDLNMILAVFPHSNLHFFKLASIFTVGLKIFFPKSGLIKRLNRLVENMDTHILSTFPSLGKYCAVVVLDLHKI
ncbi:MAG: class I SAM-dependent methyltransferase [Nitrososphaera sp.]|nr:class I SAM-dependent methyltransferase [Nitrososphaera sp.]